MANKLRVGLQLSMGGLGDQSFNDSAYAGIIEAQRLFGIEFETANWPGSMMDMEAMEKWAKRDFDLIIAIGYAYATSVTILASQYPNQKFATIDVAAAGSNVWSATYREYEGDFVMGVLAGLVTENRMVGFMGGGVTPIVRRIEAGFAQGVRYIDSSISFVSDYIGQFDDPMKGRILAETQYSMGVDVIYQVAGRCGLGAIEAAKDMGKWIISTGSDHSYLAPEAVLTSRIKDVGQPVLDVIQMVAQGEFEGGITKSYGFAEKGLRMAHIREEAKNVVTPHYQKVMEDVQNQVIQGKIQVNLD